MTQMRADLEKVNIDNERLTTVVHQQHNEVQQQPNDFKHQ